MRKIRNPAKISVNIIAKETASIIYGSDSVELSCVSPYDKPEQGCITFTSGAISSAKLEQLHQAGVLALFVPENGFDASSLEIPTGFAVLATKDPFLGMVGVIPHFYQSLSPHDGISDQAVVDPTASIGQKVRIGAFCVIGAEVVIDDGVQCFPNVIIYDGAKIGAGSILHSGVVVREDCVVGPESVIQNGAIVGADGFGYRPDPKKGLVSFPQVGVVNLAARVDIGANACVDRGALGDTVVGLGSKIDNLVQVGHNTKIGQHSILCGQVGVSGSCEIGDQVTLAGGVGVADHVSIASNTRFGARSGITSSIKEAGDYAGWPVIPASQWRRQAASLRSLPKLMKELREALKRLS